MLFNKGVFVMALTNKHAQDICLSWNGSKGCRYLTTEYSNITGGFKHLCLKLVVAEKDRIDKEVEEYLKQAKKNGQDPSVMGRPIQDNCKGYIYLKYLKQGYDLDKKKKS